MAKKPAPALPVRNPVEWAGTEGAAAILDTTAQVVRNSRHTGELFGREAPPFYQVGARKVLYKVADLHSWIEACPKLTQVGGNPLPREVAE